MNQPTRFVRILEDGDIFYQCIVKLADTDFKVILADSEKMTEEWMRHAMHVIANIDMFHHQLFAFLEAEAVNNREASIDISNLIPYSVQFANANDPALAEVAFCELDDGVVWKCCYKSGLFYSLSYDD